MCERTLTLSVKLKRHIQTGGRAERVDKRLCAADVDRGGRSQRSIVPVVDCVGVGDDVEQVCGAQFLHQVVQRRLDFLEVAPTDRLADVHDKHDASVDRLEPARVEVMHEVPAFYLTPLHFKYCHQSHLIFHSLKTAVKRNCVQCSYTYKYNKMLWRQIVNIGSYKTQLSVQSSYTYTYSKMLWRQMCRHISVISTAKYQLTRTWRGSICEGDACWQVVSPGGASTGTRLVRWR